MTNYMEYPILFKTSTDDFSTQGIGILTDALSVEVTNELNEFPELKLTYSASGDIAKELVKDRIILADVGEDYLRQKFRINEVVKTMDGKIEVSATHILNDLSFNTLKTDINAEAVTPVAAFNLAKNDFEEPEPNITMVSSITTPTKINWPVTVIDNAKKLLGGAKGSLLQIFKGEYLFDNETIHYEKTIGKKTGKVIEYGQNLIQVKQEENISATYTAIKPFAKIQSEDKKEEMIYLPERIIKTTHYKMFEKLRVLTKDFSQDKILSVDHLRSRTDKYISDNKVGIPKVSLSFEMADIKDELGFVDELSMGDEVTVYFAGLDINTTARVIKTVWDGLLHRYKTISIGDKPMTSSDYQSEQKDKVDDIENQTQENSKDLGDLEESTNQRFEGKLGYGTGEPDPEGHEDGDTYYKRNGPGDYKMYIFQDGKWVVAFPEGYDKKLREEYEKRQKDIDNQTAQLGQSITDAQAEAEKRLLEETGGLRSEISSVEKGTTSQITQLSDVIATKVSKDDFESQLTQTETLLSSQIKNQGQTVTSLSLDVQGMQSKVKSMGESVDGMESTISQLDSVIDMKVRNQTSGLSAQISTAVRNGLANIQLSAGSGRLTLTSDGNSSSVDLSGDAIHITGRTWIDDAVIRSSHIQSVDVGKLTGAEIHGFNAIYLNQNNNATVTSISPWGQTITNTPGYDPITGRYVDQANLQVGSPYQPNGQLSVYGDLDVSGTIQINGEYIYPNSGGGGSSNDGIFSGPITVQSGQLFVGYGGAGWGLYFTDVAGNFIYALHQ